MMKIYDVPSLLVTVFAASLSRHAAAELQPKMIAEPVVHGRRMKAAEATSGINTVSSSYAAYVGECTLLKPFPFNVSAGSGHGVIGIIGAVEDDYDIDCDDFVHAAIVGDKQPNLFDLDGGDDGSTVAIPFEFENESNDAGMCAVVCHQDTSVMVLFNDNSEMDAIEVKVEASVVPGEGKKVQEVIQINNGKKALHGLSASSKQNSNNGGSPDKARALQDLSVFKQNANEGGSPVKASEDADIVEAEEDRLVVEHSKAGEALFVQMEVKDDEGKVRERTIVLETTDAAPEVADIHVSRTDINEDGDFEITFTGQESGKRLLFSARIGVVPSGETDVVGDVDVSAILPSDAATLVVHGGWFRKKLAEMGLTDETEAGGEAVVKEPDDVNNPVEPMGWEIVIVDAHVQDPENMYQQVGHLVPEARGRRALHQSHARRSMLCQRPSLDEMMISQEMRQGRRKDIHGGRRSLQSNHKKILVHGYCTDRSYPLKDFTDVVEFSDPSTPTSWSHDEYALKIRDWAENEGIDGCGIIGHSQGGAAALHLYTYYYSCLDYASTGGTRLLQSVGTPYQGTSIAGDLATIGKLFLKKGCGKNDDLTYGGAKAWLAGIPDWARSAVNYYTTSFTDYWMSWDYCALTTDVLLSNPDDGITEKWSGQLPGANNRGHKEGYCHMPGMEFPAQSLDSSRNSEMNAYARY